MSERPAVSVVLCTYNRRALLPGALEALLAQEAPGVEYEVVVVDNRSDDGTAELLEGWRARAGGVLRVLAEPRPGVSFARNAGIAAARAPLVAFTDDDVRVAPDWIATIARGFREHPGAAFVGGVVAPAWGELAPAWITPDHWPPLGLADYGDAPFRCGPERAVCLLTANLAVRREAFARVGLFSPAVQRVGDGIGSLEDAELQLRFHRAGLTGMYLPAMRVTAPVEPERTTRAYHRRWHAGHGRFRSRLHDEAMERSSFRPFGVPGHVLRAAFADAGTWAGRLLRGDGDGAFLHELRVRFAAGFVRERLAAGWGGAGGEKGT
jgi:glycosyltransferase involved in cell wall biosynthesis